MTTHAEVDKEIATIRETMGEARAANSKLHLARELFEQLITSDVLPEFLTIPAYKHL